LVCLPRTQNAAQREEEQWVALGGKPEAESEVAASGLTADGGGRSRKRIREKLAAENHKVKRSAPPPAAAAAAEPAEDTGKGASKGAGKGSGKGAGYGGKREFGKPKKRARDCR